MAEVRFVPYQPVTQEEIEAYERLWSDKMAEIWREKIMQYKVRNSGRLFESVAVVSHGENRQIVHKFLEYGIYQDRGTGRETPIGNPGDIGHGKRRKKKPWFSKRFFPSVCKLVDVEGALYGAEYQAAIELAVKAIFEGK